MPCHEDLVGIWPFAEDLRPAAGGTPSSRLPPRRQLWGEVAAIRPEPVEQVTGNGAGERGVGGVRAVARVAEDADLVLDLDHEDGVLGAVELAEMSHERGEGADVGLEVGVG